MKVTPNVGKRLRARGALVLSVALAACGGAGGGSGAATPTPSSRNVIGLEDIEAANVSNALELVERLRPQWLTRATSPELTPRIYVDRVHAGDVQALRTIPAGSVASLRYRSASEATTLYGTNHAGGVIEVTLRRGG